MTECILWSGSLDRYGYGRAWNKKTKKIAKAHRLVWEEKNGLIPDNLEPDHTCRVRRCVNLDHMELVTHKENMRRGNPSFVQNAAKTHCKRGHLFDRRYGNQRQCHTCKIERQRAYRAAAPDSLIIVP